MRVAAALVLLLVSATAARAQKVEIVPFGGYRLGGSGAEGSARTPVVYDANGGVTFGALVDIPYGPLKDGLKFESLYSHERSYIKVQPGSEFDPPVRVDVTIDHLMLGGIQELEETSGHAFIGGLFGLSRFAAPDEVDVRLTIGLTVGGKFNLNRHLGLRLDARGYMTIVSLTGVGVCSGGCAVAFTVNPAFQADATAGLIIAF